MLQFSFLLSLNFLTCHRKFLNLRVYASCSSLGVFLGTHDFEKFDQRHICFRHRHLHTCVSFFVLSLLAYQLVERSE